MEYSGIVYGPEPDDPFYKLTRDDLKSMDLVGLPVKIEHMKTVVGKITASKLLDNGTMMVKYTLNKDVPGYITDQLIKDGHLTELSLSHIDNGTRKIPTEVSVVFKGARPETKILRSQAIEGINRQREYISGGEQNFVRASYKQTLQGLMSGTEDGGSTPQAMEAPAAAVAADSPHQAEENAAKAAAAAPLAEPSAVGSEEPAAKRQKTDGPASADEDCANMDPSRRLEVLERIVAGIPDFETKKQLYGLTSGLMAEIMEKEKICNDKDNQISSLNKIKETNEANTEANARSTAAVIAELLQLYNPQYVKNDSLSDEFVRTMSTNPQVYEFLRPIEVCASQIKAEREQINNAKRVQELDAYRKKCEQLQSQLGAYTRMGGHVPPVVKEVQQPVEMAAVAPKPVEHEMWKAAVPAVQVAASAGKAAMAPAGVTQKKESVIPEFLRKQLGSYNNGSYGSDRVMPSDFSRPIASKPQ